MATSICSWWSRLETAITNLILLAGSNALKSSSVTCSWIWGLMLQLDPFGKFKSQTPDSKPWRSTRRGWESLISSRSPTSSTSTSNRPASGGTRFSRTIWTRSSCPYSSLPQSPYRHRISLTMTATLVPTSILIFRLRTWGRYVETKSVKIGSSTTTETSRIHGTATKIRNGAKSKQEAPF